MLLIYDVKITSKIDGMGPLKTIILHEEYVCLILIEMLNVKGKVLAQQSHR